MLKHLLLLVGLLITSSASAYTPLYFGPPLTPYGYNSYQHQPYYGRSYQPRVYFYGGLGYPVPYYGFRYDVCPSPYYYHSPYINNYYFGH